MQAARDAGLRAWPLTRQPAHHGALRSGSCFRGGLYTAGVYLTQLKQALPKDPSEHRAGHADVPGRRGCPVIPMGAIPRLFMAVAQAVGSDIGKPIGMESRLRFPSAEAKKKGDQELRAYLNSSMGHPLPRFCSMGTQNQTQTEHVGKSLMKENLQSLSNRGRFTP